MGEAKRKTYTASFKAKVGLEAIRGVKTTNEIGQEHGVHYRARSNDSLECAIGGKKRPQLISNPSVPYCIAIVLLVFDGSRCRYGTLKGQCEGK
jgi:hypothetical protein